MNECSNDCVAYKDGFIQAEQQMLSKLEVCKGCGFIKTKGLPLSVYLHGLMVKCCPMCDFMDLRDFCMRAQYCKISLTND